MNKRFLTGLIALAAVTSLSVTNIPIIGVQEAQARVNPVVYRPPAGTVVEGNMYRYEFDDATWGHVVCQWYVVPVTADTPNLGPEIKDNTVKIGDVSYTDEGSSSDHDYVDYIHVIQGEPGNVRKFNFTEGRDETGHNITLEGITFPAGTFGMHGNVTNEYNHTVPMNGLGAYMDSYKKGISIEFQIPQTAGKKFNVDWDGETHESWGESSGDYTNYNSFSNKYVTLLPLESGNPASDSTALAQQALNYYPAGNGTTAWDLTNKVNSVVDISKYYTNVSITDRLDSTESNAGYIKGTVTTTLIANTAKTFTAQFNNVISANLQSASTIYTSLNSYCQNYNATNASNSSNFTSAVKITNPALSVGVSGWQLIPANDKLTGSLSCTVTVYQNGTPMYNIPVTKTVAKLADTAATAKAQVDSVLANYNATNSLDALTLLNDLKKVVDTQFITLSLSGFSKTDSTEASLGLVKGTVIVKDTYGTTLYSDVNMKVDYIPQSINTVANLFTNYINTVEIKNNTTANDILNAVKITNQNITASLGDLVINPSTDLVEGSATGNIVIKEGATTLTVPINNIIKKVYMHATTAENILKAGYLNTSVSNLSTKASVLQSLNNMINTSEITLNYGTGIEDFNIIPATEQARGRVTGLVYITDKYGETQTLNLDKEVDYLAESVDTVASKYTDKLSSYIGADATVEGDLLSLVNITNNDIKSEMLNFKSIVATDVRDGRITGIVRVTNTRTGETKDVPVAIDIPYLTSELGTATKYVQQYLSTVVPVNGINFTELLRGAKTVVNNNNINLSYSFLADETPKETDSTEDSVGVISGSIILDDGTTTVKVPVNYTVPRLPQTIAGAKLKVDNMLKSYKATNYTEEDNILNYLSGAVTGVPGSVITLGTSGFDKTSSTETTTGAMVGFITINDDKGNTDNISLENIVIDKLPQTLDGIKQLIVDSKSTLKVSNKYNTTNLSADLTKLITGASGSKISLFVDEDRYFVTPATIDTTGNISAIVELVDSNANRSKINLEIPISKLPQTVEDAMSKSQKLWEDYNPSNGTSESELNNLFGSIITGTPGSNITARMSNYELNPSSDSDAGSVEGVIIVSDNYGHELQQPIGKSIGRISVPNASAVSRVQVVIPDLEADNDTTEESLIDQIYSKSRLPRDTVSLTINDFHKDKSTGLSTGRVTGILNIKTIVDGVEISQNLDLSIAKLNRTIEDAKVDIDPAVAIVSAEIADRVLLPDSTSTNIKTELTTVLDNPTVSLEWKEKPSYLVPTNHSNGNFDGVIVVRDLSGNIITEKDMSVNISKIPSTIEDAKVDIDPAITKVSAEIAGRTLVPDGKSINVKNELTKVLDNSTVTLEWKENPIYVSPTRVAEGRYSGNLLVKDAKGDVVLERSIDSEISKLPSTIEDAKVDIDPAINKVSAEILAKTLIPDDTSTNVKSKLTTILDNSTVTLEWKENPIYLAPTTSDDGNFSGTVLGKDGSGNVIIERPMNVTIAKIPSVIEGKKTEIENKIKEITGLNIPGATNPPITSLEDFKKAISDILGDGTDVTVDYSHLVVINPTTTSDGSITGYIILTDSKGDSRIINVDIFLPRLAKVINSGGSSGGSGGGVIINSAVSTDLSLSLDNTAATLVKTSSSNLNVSDMLGQSVAKQEAYNWEALDKNSNILNKGLVYVGKDATDKVVGLVVDSDTAIGSTAKVQIDAKDTNAKAVYSYVDELSKYAKSSQELTNTSTGISFTGSDKKRYVVTAKELDANKVANSGWNDKAVNNNTDWYYLNGENCVSGWVNDGTGWYNLDTDKKMNTGWVKDKSGDWYYLNTVSDGTKGKMQTGWEKDKDTWYYMSKDITTEGKMQTGWINDNGTWYYTDSDGRMVTGDQTIDGTNYSFSDSGSLK